MDKLIKELLSVPESQLLQHEKVVAAYWELKGTTKHKHTITPFKQGCTKCGCKIKEADRPNGGMPIFKWDGSPECSVPDPIPGSLADVAEDMVAACKTTMELKRTYVIFLYVTMGKPEGCDMADLVYAVPIEQIIAATLAWWEGQG